jgi:hypothetical protein
VLFLYKWQLLGGGGGGLKSSSPPPLPTALPCKVIQESRIRLLIALQSGIQTVESRIHTSEESLSWPNFLESTTDLELIRNPREEYNSESKECMDYLTWGELWVWLALLLYQLFLISRARLLSQTIYIAFEIMARNRRQLACNRWLQNKICRSIYVIQISKAVEYSCPWFLAMMSSCFVRSALVF